MATANDTHEATLGKVYLVGGGPGDPGLLTLRGRECLERADLVLYDGLVSPLLLRHTRADCERTSRAATPKGARLNQEEINRRLIEAARGGKVVVRLKGGDPFLFGRGSEEAAALAAAGIPFEVVPGVTAALAAATYAGLSLTHRQLASCVALVTGHEDPVKESKAIDYDALARFSGTLVFYMGLHRIAAIAAALIERGKDPRTPACVVSRATTPRQRIVEGSLGELAGRVATSELYAPSLIIIGEAVSQRQAIAWFEKKPLYGQRIAVTRPVHQADSVIDELIALGADPIPMPLLEIGPPPDWDAIDTALGRLSDFDWLVFTSANGVDAFLGRIWSSGRDIRALGRLRTAAIGPATARRMETFHLRADLIPEEYRAEGLVHELGPLVARQRVLWIGANRGRDVLIEGLRHHGAQVEKLVVYESRDIPALSDENLDLLRQGELDWIPLGSPSMAHRLKALLPPEANKHIGTRIKLASISPVTTAAAESAGLPVAAEASEFTWPGMLQAILSKVGGEREREGERK